MTARVAVVTGAAGAMGAGCARALASSFDALVLTDLHADALSAVGAGCVSAEVCTVAGDLTDPDLVARLVAETRARGEFGALVNTAGLSPTMAGWREILRVDLVAVARLLDAFFPIVVPGTVAVCIASVSGHMGAPDRELDAVLRDPLAPGFDAAYRALTRAEPDAGWTYRCAKLGVIQLCARTAVRWGACGGRVVSLSPGLVDTGMGRLELANNEIKAALVEMTPLAPSRLGPETPLPGRIDDIARTVDFLCSANASFISGCDVLVDGGLLAAMNNSTSGGIGGG